MSPDIAKYLQGGNITPSWEPLNYRKKNEYLFCISDYVRYRLNVLCNPEHYLLKSNLLFKDWEPEGWQGWCGGGVFIFFLIFGSFFIFQHPTMKMHYNQRNSQWLLLIFALIIPRPVFPFSIVCHWCLNFFPNISSSASLFFFPEITRKYPSIPFWKQEREIQVSVWKECYKKILLLSIRKFISA